MILWTLVKRGKHLNYTLSSVKYDNFGKKVNNNITVCDDWKDGIERIRDREWSHLLMISSGTVFKDWTDWVNFVQNYPVKDLVGHLIWHPHEKFPSLNEQCTLVSRDHIDIFLEDKNIDCPQPIKNNKNIHDDYTPAYIDYDKVLRVNSSGPIANALSKRIKIVNWNNLARDKKYFLYNNEVVKEFCESQKSYCKLVENQLWILNNEPVNILQGKNILTVGSGLYWVMNIIQDTVDSLTICDISTSQIELCRELWNSWDGINYGEFVYDFIKANNIKNFQLDNPELSRIDFIKLNKKENFCNYVNTKFNSICDDLNIVDFSEKWKAVKNKKIQFFNENILKIDNTGFDTKWLSNAEDFKWTLLHE